MCANSKAEGETFNHKVLPLCNNPPPPHPYLLKVKTALIKDEVTLPFIGTTISVTRLASLTRSQRRDSAGIYFLRMPPSLERSGRCGGGGAESSAPASMFSAKWKVDLSCHRGWGGGGLRLFCTSTLPKWPPNNEPGCVKSSPMADASADFLF